MLETPHVAVGAALASKIPNPLISIPAAFASHFILERIPHWNPHLNRELKKYGKVTKSSTKIVILDASLALILGSFIAYRALPNINQAIFILLASFASVVPDLIEAPHFFLKIRKPFIEKWIIIQKSIQEDADIIPGLATQIFTVAVAVFWAIA